MDKPSGQETLRILQLEDEPTDAELAASELREAGMSFVSMRVDTRDAFIQALEEFRPDIVLSDYKLPAFDGGSALRIVREHHPDVPVLMVTGVMGDEKAIELLKLGARDYILKDRLGRLVPAVQRALSEERGIRARKAAEAALRESEQSYRMLADSAPALIWASGTDKLCNYFNQPWLKFTGRTLEQEMGNGWADGVHPDDFQRCLDVYLSAFDRRKPFSMEYRLRRHDGEYRWMRDDGCPRYDSEGNFTGYLGYLMDVTEHKQAEATVHESEEIFRYFMEYSPIYIFFKDKNIRSIRLSRNYEMMLGKPLKELLGKNMDELFPSNLAKDMVADDMRIMREGKECTVDEELNGRHYSTIKFPIRIDGELRYLAGYTIDITERKEAEVAIAHANRALATLSAVNKSLVRASDEHELLQSICQSIVGQYGYRMAWVGYKQHDDRKSMKVVASAGYDEGYLDMVNVSWAETERGLGPTGRAIRSGTTQLCQDFAGDLRHLPWREEALDRGYLSSIALPLANGEVFGALTVYSGETNAFTPGEVALLEEMAGDLAFGVHALHVRRERDLALEQSRQRLDQLRDNLEETVRAIASMVEMRAPYTAGHQAKVANLAVAIARQMGLPDEQVHGIHLAGVVHDLGKIRVPAEILSKPGKITDIEFSLIKVHPQAGYNILKDINFPWPIAQMVLQHHERLDGSGYPQGLKGDAIMLEARILNVADVVEAMSAHRPYRAGFGIEAALEEISKNRGVVYDQQVVEACVSVFREQGYVFPS